MALTELADGTEILDFGSQHTYSTVVNNQNNDRFQVRNFRLRVSPVGENDYAEFINNNDLANTIFIPKSQLLKHHYDVFQHYQNGRIFYQAWDVAQEQDAVYDFPELDYNRWLVRLNNLIEKYGDNDRIRLPIGQYRRGQIRVQGIHTPENAHHTYLFGSHLNAEDRETWQFLLEFLIPNTSSIFLTKVDDFEFEMNFYIDELPDSIEIHRLAEHWGLTPRNWLWYGAPGTGKSYGLGLESRNLLTNVNQGEITFDFFPYSFSPATAYSDFVGEYRPNMIYNSDDLPVFVNSAGAPLQQIQGTPVVNYSFTPGIFTQALVRAFTNQGNRVVLLIDEINRGDIYEILGEVFQLMERNEYGMGSYPLALSPAAMDYINAATGRQSNSIQLPENLYVWGTMNPNDSSVQQIDSAFFRRWIVRYISIDYQTENAEERDMILIGGPLNVRWGELRLEINRLLGEMGYDEEEFIGRYFVKSNEFNDWNRFYSKLVFHLANNVMKGNLQDNLIFSASSVREIMRTCERGDNPFRIDEFENAQFGIEEVAVMVADEVAVEAADEVAEEVVIEAADEGAEEVVVEATDEGAEGVADDNQGAE